MKKTLLTIAAIGMTMSAAAQTLNIVAGSVTYAVPAAQAGDITYQNGATLTVMGKTLQTSDITRMYVDNSTVTDNTVNIVYNGTEATVTVWTGRRSLTLLGERDLTPWAK